MNKRRTVEEIVDCYAGVLDMLAAYDRGEIDENGDPCA